MRRQCLSLFFPSIRLITAVLAAFLSGTISAQDRYIADPNYILSKHRPLERFTRDYPDSSITNLNNPFPVNYLGNIGLPSPQYVFRYGTDELRYFFYRPPYDNDRIANSQVKYYNTKGPFGDLEGVAGPNIFQSFRMLFTHTFNRNFNIAVKFNRYTSQGFYRRQQTYSNNFYLSGNSTGKRGRAGLYFYLLNNANRHNENGGLRDTLLNDSTAALPSQLMRVKLSQANRDNRETFVSVNPWFRLDRSSDTTGAGTFLHIRSRYSTGSFKYLDGGLRNDNFYDRYYLDTVRTSDSSHVLQLTNEAGIAYTTHGKKLSAYAGYRHELTRTWQFADSILSGHALTGELVYNERATDDTSTNVRQLQSALSMQYFLAGNYAGTCKIESRSSLISADEKLALSLRMLAEERIPDYRMEQWVSNHFRFHNELKNVQQLQFAGAMSYRRFIHVEAVYQTIRNYIYFDQQAMPAQFGKTVHNTGITVSLRKLFFRHLGLHYSHTYQNTSHAQIVRIPSNVSTGGMYYYGNLFRKNLQVQLGVQGTLYGSFKPYDYMPATQAFYLQDDYATRTYPYIDVYLNARIRPVTVFLKFQNVGQGYFGADYTFTRGYYQPGISFWYGLRWLFFD